jgi:peptide/nickel transport system substrate-binding protein
LGIEGSAVFLARLMTVLMFAACAAAASDLRLGISAEPSSLDPHFHNLASNNGIAAHIFEALTKFDSDSMLVPALAESWRLIDDTTWEFKLRKGVKFHDGTELTAEDVIWSLDRPATITNSPGAFTLYTPDRQQADRRSADDSNKDRESLSVDAERSLVDLYCFAKRHAGRRERRLRQWQGHDRYRALSLCQVQPRRASGSRSQRYLLGQQAAWDRVTFRFLSNDSARLAALLAGDVDAIDNVPSADFVKLKSNPNFRVFSKVSSRIIYFTLDQGRDTTPFVSDKSGKPLPANPSRICACAGHSTRPSTARSSPTR